MTRCRAGLPRRTARRAEPRLARRDRDSDGGEVADTRPGELDAFSHQTLTFQQLVAAVPAEPTIGADDAVIGETGDGRAPHDIADGARSAWSTGQRRHLTVGGDPTRGDATDDAQDARGEFGLHGLVDVMGRDGRSAVDVAETRRVCADGSSAARSGCP